MIKIPLDQDFALLKTAVEEAAVIAMSHFQKGDFQIFKKEGDEPVTEIDLKINTALKKTLLTPRPQYGWLSEESGDDLARLKKEFVWIVDPIDGTRAFMRGQEDFSIAVALLKDGHPVLGIICAPALGKFYSAQKGKGAFLNGKKISISNKKDFKNFKVQSDDSYLANKNRWKFPWPDMEVTKFQSFALRLATFAGGETDAVLAAKPKSEWDIAAGEVLIQEAGGILCDQKGKAFTYNQTKTEKHQIIGVSPGLKGEFLKLVSGRIPKNIP